MKKQVLFLVLAVFAMGFIFAAVHLSWGQEVVNPRQQAIEDRIGRINAEIQLVQGDLNALVRKYPLFFGDKGTARKEIEAVLGMIFKKAEAELVPLGKELGEIRAKQTPAPAPAKGVGTK